MNAKSNLIRFLLLLALIAVQGVTPAAAQSQSTISSSSMPADLYQAVLNSTAKSAQGNSSLQSSDGTYHFNTDGLNAAFNSNGLALSGAKAEAWNWNLQVNGFGRGANPQGISSAVSSESKNGIATQHYSGFSQWMRMTGIGLEQGFTVDQSPQGNGLLVLRMGLNTNLNGSLSKDSRSLSFKTGDGRTLYYSNLRAFDANNKELDAKLVYTSRQIIIQVDDTHAVYPLTVDPLMYFESKVVSLDGAAGDRFGYSVAISGDTAVIGAFGKATSQGVAYIFQRTGLTWIQQAELLASNGAIGDQFGSSVAISGDTVIVGARGCGGAEGAAYVFVEPASGWKDMTQSAYLFASDYWPNDQFGYSVAISGNTAIIGARGKTVGGNINRGKAYIFVKPVSGWTNTSETAGLTASDGAANDNFGGSVAISGDTAIVGAYGKTIGANSGQGKAYIFVKPYSGWTTTSTFTAGLTASDGAAADVFGSSVAISGDTAIVGASSYNIFRGKVYVFAKPSGGWATTSTFTAGLTASDTAANDFFGSSVAISGDTIMVGAYGKSSSQGKAYIFAKPAGNWVTATETSSLTASDAAANDNFGQSVAISGGTAVVAAYVKNNYQGSAYIYFPYSPQDLSVQAFASSAAPLPNHTMTLTASVTNYGNSSVSAVALSAPLPSGFTYSSNAASFGNYDPGSAVWSVGTLGAGATATLAIRAVPGPSLAGTQAVFTPSLLAWDTNYANNSASVTMNIPLLSFNLASVAFPNQLIQTAGSAVRITATNLSSDDITIGALSISTGFLLSSNFCDDATLASSETCTFNVQFKPMSATVYSGQVTVPATGPVVTTYLPLSGKGLAGTKVGILNPSFESATAKVPTNWTKGGTWAMADGQDCTTFHNGLCSLKFTGTGVIKSVAQTITLSGVSGDDFVFSMWARALSVPFLGSHDAKIQIYNGPTLVTTKALTFTTGTYGFTKSTLAFTMTAVYTKLVVTLEYNAATGSNSIWFDDVNLVWAP